MKFVLKIPEAGALEFPEYSDAIFALTQVHGSLDGIKLEERDDRGNVRGIVQGEDLERIVAETRGIAGASVLLRHPGRTLKSDE